MTIYKNSVEWRNNIIYNNITFIESLSKSTIAGECIFLVKFKQQSLNTCSNSVHDDVIKWNYFCVTGSLWVDSPHKGQWRVDLMFSLICVWTNGWANNQDASNLRHRAHYDVNVMEMPSLLLRQLFVSSSSPGTKGIMTKATKKSKINQQGEVSAFVQ